MSDVQGRDGATALPGFLAWSPEVRRIAELAARAAVRASTVLITGEHGAGKSCLARGLATLAKGTSAPLVVIDCASLPADLAENELFGHEAGAYSGAAGRAAGKFEAAHGGTVLLDRVSDLPVAIQPKLLRVLQERTFERVGGQRSVSIDVLVIATSSEDLAALARAGAFREDLFYRLDVVHLELPPLRTRPEDLEGLARVFAGRASGRQGRHCHIDAAGLEALRAHAWRGNVRELENVIERAMAFSETETLDAHAVMPSLTGHAAGPEGAIASLAEFRLSLDQVEALYIAHVLRAVGGKVAKAAALLGIHRKTLLEKRKRQGLP